MHPGRLAVLILAAAAAGAGAGWLARPRDDAGLGRPRAVEAVLRAVDREDRAGLERALAGADAPDAYALPWRDEVAFGRLVLAGDPDGVWGFATAGPPSAARARALLWLRTRAATIVEWKRAEARLEADYPASWALRPEGTKSPEAGR